MITAAEMYRVATAESRRKILIEDIESMIRLSAQSGKIDIMIAKTVGQFSTVSEADWRHLFHYLDRAGFSCGWHGISGESLYITWKPTVEQIQKQFGAETHKY